MRGHRAFSARTQRTPFRGGSSSLECQGTDGARERAKLGFVSIAWPHILFPVGRLIAAVLIFTTVCTCYAAYVLTALIILRSCIHIFVKNQRKYFEHLEMFELHKIIVSVFGNICTVHWRALLVVILAL